MTDNARSSCTGRGIDLAVECAYLGQWSDPLATDSGTPVPVGRPAIPPSALVPRFHEPIRTDVSWPPHPRGSGQPWPPEAHVDETTLCGRLPMAYAWELLRNNRHWVWPDGSDPISGADAICAVVRDVCGGTMVGRQQPPVVLVIPNTLSESHQQSLLDAGRAEGLEIKLLWRPVAAALSWCNINSQKLQEQRHDIDCPMGRLLVLHMGFDVFEATILDVVPRAERDKTWFLPARHRPDRQRDAIGSFGYDLLIALTSHYLRSEHRPAVASTIWNRMWCTSWLRCVLESLVGTSEEASAQYRRQVYSTVTSDALCEVWQSQIGKILKTRIPGSRTDGDLGGYLCGGFSTTHFNEWKSDCSSAIAKEPLLGAIVTGPLAGAPGGQHATLGRMFLSKLGFKHEEALIEGASLPFGLLAEGAACYSSRLHADLPTYLDTLPELQTVIRRRGEPVWIDLLSSDDSFVEGGREWRRPHNVDNLEIQAHQDELTLAVHHEEHTHVREVTAQLPQEYDEKRPVSLSVAIEPAQGNARIEVVPDDVGLFGRRRIVVDWKRMAVFQDKNGDKKTPAQYLDSLPRIYPPLSKREHSRVRWQAAQNVMYDATRFIAAMPSEVHTHTTINRVLEALKSKDPDYYPKDATAISSDGRVSVRQGVLDSFVEAMCAALPQFSSRHAEVCIRTLAYTSTDHPAFRKLIISMIEAFLADGSNARLGQHVLTACGWCLRDPEDIQMFARACKKYMQNHNTNLNIWLKAISEILRYRGHATRDMDSTTAQYLIQKALATFVVERDRNNGNYLFRYSCLIIVYLLRRRAYDDEFLPPDKPLAVRVKNDFSTAIEACKRNRLTLIGGAVDLAAALQTMIDYIDRRGRGSILLGVD